MKDITGATVYNSRVIKISAAVDNTGISTAYTINTIGIYAKVGSSAESLFALVTASAADTMPAYDSRPYSYIYEINLTMQNAANVTVAVNAAGLVNVADLNAAKVEIQGEIADLKSHFVNRTFTVTKTTMVGKGWDYFNNFAEKTLAGYYACSFTVEGSTLYRIQARNIGTNTTFAIGFIDSNGEVISSIANLPTNPDHYADVTTPSNCVLVKFTTNSQTTPRINVTTQKLQIPVDEKILYVATNGDDNYYDGTREKPFYSIQKAISTNLADTIVVGGGRYQAPIDASNRKKLKIIGAVDGSTVIDYTTAISPATGSSGVKEATFSSTSSDPIYKVFVSHELPISQTANATAYTVNLWTSDGLTLLIPKKTITEVQGTDNTWTYDGTKLYINGTAASYKLVTGYEDIAAKFENIQDLIIENIAFKFAGYTNCLIQSCANAEIIGCEFSNAGRQHGLALENSNVTVTKCTAFRNCYDGFNIHQKGYSKFVDCESGYNRDDGISHHDGSTGTIIGGKYHHNTKGGISPTYDAVVDVYNAVCDANGYGIYYAVATGTRDCIISGCLLSNNNGYGLRVNGSYRIMSLGTLYTGNNANSKADNGGTIWAVGENT